MFSTRLGSTLAAAAALAAQTACGSADVGDLKKPRQEGPSAPIDRPTPGPGNVSGSGPSSASPADPGSSVSFGAIHAEELGGSTTGELNDPDVGVEPDQLEYDVDRDPVVSLTLRNDKGVVSIAEDALAVLERRVGNIWKETQVVEVTVAGAGNYTEGEFAVLDLELDDDLAPGAYRVALTIARGYGTSVTKDVVVNSGTFFLVDHPEVSGVWRGEIEGTNDVVWMTLQEGMHHIVGQADRIVDGAQSTVPVTGLYYYPQISIDHGTHDIEEARFFGRLSDDASRFKGNMSLGDGTQVGIEFVRQ